MTMMTISDVTQLGDVDEYEVLDPIVCCIPHAFFSKTGSLKGSNKKVLILGEKYEFAADALLLHKVEGDEVTRMMNSE